MTDERDQADPQTLIIEELRQANVWLRVLAAPVLRERLAEALDTDTNRRIYQASTGGSGREVAKEAGVSQPTVRTAWQKWAVAGIVMPTDTPGRYERLVDVNSIGLEG